MRLKRFLILWVTLSSAAFSFADDFVYDNLKYATNSDNSVTLVDGKSANGDVIIPSDVRNKTKFMSLQPLNTTPLRATMLLLL